MSTAVERGSQLFTEVLIKDIPSEAFIYAQYLCRKVGVCGEVMLTAYAVYAQIVEKLECDDDLYRATPEIRAEWEVVQRDYERIAITRDGRELLTIQLKADAGN